ncbi:hypothetical protein O181_032946 [Austropuccinia psidii MF-1]|uniref:Uncharacterized protein n=1 Tax=Austropuccinia psidii MF-1 TaxID=1389203 RepID=A0A9Q3CXT0_9BASI|nr:hypothetical protein [Austropuccinia psidii MF-1]
MAARARERGTVKALSQQRSRHPLPLRGIENHETLLQYKKPLLPKGTNQRTEKAFTEPEDLEEETLYTVLDGKTLRKSYPPCHLLSNSPGTSKQRTGKTWIKFFSSTNSSKIYFNGAWTTRGFDLASHWVELGASFQKICLKEIDFKDLMIITKGWNSTRQFRILEVRANRIRENQATIQALEEQPTQTGHNQIPSGSQGIDQTSCPVASNHSGINRSVAKSHHSSQYQEVSRRRQGYKGKKRPPSTKQRESQNQCPESVGFGERSTQEPEVAVHNSRISSPINRNIPPLRLKIMLSHLRVT